MLSNSDLSGNSEGVHVNGGDVMLKTSVLANNTTNGVTALGGTTWLARTAIYGNRTGVIIVNATVNSFGDNDIAGNTTPVNGLGALTQVSTQ